MSIFAHYCSKRIIGIDIYLCKKDTGKPLVKKKKKEITNAESMTPTYFFSPNPDFLGKNKTESFGRTL